MFNFVFRDPDTKKYFDLPPSLQQTNKNLNVKAFKPKSHITGSTSTASTTTNATSNENDWSEDVEIILDKIRQNSIILSEHHKKHYFSLQSWLKYFRLPCIILSSINAVASIGLQSYLEQKKISLITCVISLITTIITSTELYLQIEKQMTIEIEVSKEYYLLSVDIFKTLSLNRDHRNIDATSYLDSCLSNYKNLYENSGVLEKKIRDQMTLVDCDMITPDLNGYEDMPCHPTSPFLPSTDEMDFDGVTHSLSQQPQPQPQPQPQQPPPTPSEPPSAVAAATALLSSILSSPDPTQKEKDKDHQTEDDDLQFQDPIMCDSCV